MKLFLTSYLAGTKNLVNDFLSELQPREIVFVPTAANVEEYRGYVDEAIAAFQEMGFELRTLDVSKAEPEEALSMIKACRCLYVSGGNTFYLLQELKKKGLVTVIKSRVKDGMLYVGESAGAIIASHNVEYGQIMDDRSVAAELEDYSGLGLVDYCVLPHSGEFPFVEAAAETIARYGEELNLVPLNNREAVVVDGNGYSVKLEE